MNEQLPLFGSTGPEKAAGYDLYGGRPPHVRTDTSLEAALEIEQHVTRLAAAVLAFIQDREEGATCAEVEVGLSMSHQTASARIRELVLKEQIEDSGERRRTPSGRKAAVWKIRRRKTEPPPGCDTGGGRELAEPSGSLSAQR